MPGAAGCAGAVRARGTTGPRRCPAASPGGRRTPASRQTALKSASGTDARNQGENRRRVPAELLVEFTAATGQQSPGHPSRPGPTVSHSCVLMCGRCTSVHLCSRLHAANGDSNTPTCSPSCSGPTSRPTTRPSARSSIGQLADAAIGQGLGDRRGDRRTASWAGGGGTGPTGSRPCRRGCGDECVVSAVAVRRLVIRGAGSPPRRAGRGRSCGAWRTRA